MPLSSLQLAFMSADDDVAEAAPAAVSQEESMQRAAVSQEAAGGRAEPMAWQARNDFMNYCLTMREALHDAEKLEAGKKERIDAFLRRTMDMLNSPEAIFGSQADFSCMQLELEVVVSAMMQAAEDKAAAPPPRPDLGLPGGPWPGLRRLTPVQDADEDDNEADDEDEDHEEADKDEAHEAHEEA